MAISVQWPTGVITVPLADLTLISGNRYSFDVLQFHLDLRTEEATQDGAPFTRTHDHNADIVLSGVVYADVVEVLPPYTVEFEDGQRQIVLLGANHNLSDVQVTNQVGLITQNSAGLISVADLAASLADLLDAQVLAVGQVISGSTATSIRTDLNQADDYWDGHIVTVVLASGPVARRINGYLNTNGELILLEDLPAIPVAGDQIFIRASHKSNAGGFG